MNDAQISQRNDIETIQFETISNKRKSNECNPDNNDNEPDRKKRKLNGNNIADKLNTLFKSNKFLQKQNNSLIQQNNQLTKTTLHYQEGIHLYKNEANKWKSNYNKLYSQLLSFTNGKNNNNSDKQFDDSSNNNKPKCTAIKRVENHSTNNKPSFTIPKQSYDSIKRVTNQKQIDNKYNSVRDRLLQMGFDKQQIINRVALYNGSNKKSEFVFNQLINTFTHDISPKKRTLRSHAYGKSGKKLKTNSVKTSCDIDINNKDFIEFEKSYYISINCHICNIHFKDMCKYKFHLKQHYDDNNNNKIWMNCDFSECNKKKLKSSEKFIGHISSHLNTKPFKCNVINNGIKCIESRRWKGDIKKHWKSHFKCNKKKIKFEDSYYVFVDCHICKKHFDDFGKYERHIELHYICDPNKVWKQCDLGCTEKKQLFRDNKYFISHIAQHTNQKPFKCNVTVKGVKCEASCGSKANFKRHWQIHCKQKTKE